METIREQLEELPAALNGADMIQQLGHDTWSNRLFPAYDALVGLVSLTEELLRREQGRAGVVAGGTAGAAGAPARADQINRRTESAIAASSGGVRG